MKSRKEILDLFHKIKKTKSKDLVKELFSYNIILIGFMGAGKSTVAIRLSKFLGLKKIEMDDMIVKREGMSIPEIFESKGEAYFRDLESQVILDLKGVEQAIISCGGGAVLREKNVKAMKEYGRIVLLTATPETILKRVKHSNKRPILNGNKNVEFIAELLEKRRKAYETAADIVVATDNKSFYKICEEIVIKMARME